MSNYRSAPPDIEFRQAGHPVQLRASSGRKIQGYAAVFGCRSEDLGGFIEQVDHRAFNQGSGDGWRGVVARWNHDDNFLLGTTEAGTLQLTVDARGLHYVVDLPECRADLAELAARGDISKSSFAFRAFHDSWDLVDGLPLRTLVDVQLIDVAPVNRPAYKDSTAALRSLAKFAGAPLADVIDKEARGELRKFFVRTDAKVINVAGRPLRVQHRGLNGPDALVYLMSKRYGPHEADADGRPRVGRDGIDSLVEIQSKRWTSNDR